MKTAASLLATTAPAWFGITRRTPNELIGLARYPKTVWARAGLALRIFGSPVPSVREEKIGTELPTFCPERHINGDGTFCLGLPAPAVRSKPDAEQWWLQFGQFLRCQTVAMGTEIWPPAYALDHGNAGHHHRHAEALAEQAGVSEEYQSARLGEPSWIVDRKLRLFGKQGEPINGRSPCPRGCRRRARGQLVPILRVDCEKRSQLTSLAFHEEQRLAELDKFWKALIAKGSKCCGTMPNCPLK